MPPVGTCFPAQVMITWCLASLASALGRWCDGSYTLAGFNTGGSINGSTTSIDLTQFPSSGQSCTSSLRACGAALGVFGVNGFRIYSMQEALPYTAIILTLAAICLCSAVCPSIISHLMIAQDDTVLAADWGAAITSLNEADKFQYRLASADMLACLLMSMVPTIAFNAITDCASYVEAMATLKGCVGEVVSGVVAVCRSGASRWASTKLVEISPGLERDCSV